MSGRVREMNNYTNIDVDIADIF